MYILYFRKIHDSQSTTVVPGCKQCNRGKYQDGVASSSCKDCSEGQYGATMGGTTCTRCAKGRFNDLRGLQVQPIASMLRRTCAIL